MRNAALIPGSGRFLGGGHGNLLQYSCLENPMDRGAWWAKVHGVAKRRTRLTRLGAAHTTQIKLAHKGVCALRGALQALGEGIIIVDRRAEVGHFPKHKCRVLRGEGHTCRLPLETEIWNKEWPTCTPQQHRIGCVQAFLGEKTPLVCV